MLQTNAGGLKAESTGTAGRGGERLDAGTRAFFEPRLSQDFADVRVHTDAQAAASARTLDARAYTQGSDVFFGAGEYRPHTAEGRFVLAHELAHVAQQRGAGNSTATEDASLEREASRSAIRVALGGSAPVSAGLRAPGVQCLKVSAGGFGRELEWYTNEVGIPDSVVKILQKSPTFMWMAQTLDQHYVAMIDGSFNLDASGRVTYSSIPGALGKRVIIIYNLGGPSFKTAVSSETLWGDRIDLSGGTSKELFLSQLIHESAHATRFVTGANPSTTTLQQEIDAGIKDEIAVRTTTDKALMEIPDKDVNALAGTAVKSRREVERDISPATNLTYLEHFFLSRKLREQQKAENLTDGEAQKIAEDVRQYPSSGVFYERTFGSGQFSDYAFLCYWRERSANEWKAFLEKNNPSDPDFTTKKDAILQDHAKNLFKGEISYTP